MGKHNWQQWFEPSLGKLIRKRSDLTSWPVGKLISRARWLQLCDAGVMVNTLVEPNTMPAIVNGRFEVLDPHSGLVYEKMGSKWMLSTSTAESYSAYVCEKIKHTLNDIEDWSLISTRPAEFTVDTREALEDIATTVSSEIRRNNATPWFRGQTNAYSYNHPAASRREFGMSYLPDSLVPSVGRLKLTPQDLDTWKDMIMGCGDWQAAMFIWLAAQREDWFWPYPGMRDSLVASVERFDVHDFFAKQVEILMGQGAKLDDLRQAYYESERGNNLQGLVLQHYGFPTCYLDVTDDLNVALYFALEKPANVSVDDPQKGGILYIIADSIRAKSVQTSEELFAFLEEVDWPIPPRVRNQRSAFLTGATEYSINYYAHLVVAKITVAGSLANELSINREFIYPGPEVDTLYALLKKFRPVLDRLH